MQISELLVWVSILQHGSTHRLLYSKWKAGQQTPMVASEVDASVEGLFCVILEVFQENSTVSLANSFVKT